MAETVINGDRYCSVCGEFLGASCDPFGRRSCKKGCKAAAVISECGQYRYFLTRPREVMAPERGPALFVMLNPSTADASQDDPTIRKCRGFARVWNCLGLTVANLYAYRATDPRELKRQGYPVGPENDDYLRSLAREHGDVICAWGANAEPARARAAAQIFLLAGARLWCLGTTKDGHPKHPLYIPYEQPLIPWEMPA